MRWKSHVRFLEGERSKGPTYLNLIPRYLSLSTMNGSYYFILSGNDVNAITIPPWEYGCKTENKKSSRSRSKRSEACYLMRDYAYKLTISWISILIWIGIQVLHGCRQSVSWDVRLTPLTDEIPVVNLYLTIFDF